MMKHLTMSLAVIALAGCASLQLPTDRLERSAASIRGAEEVGALAVPAANLHLQLAKDQTAAAKRLAANGDDRAILVLARGEADAELALAIAREASVHAAALKADEDLRTVMAGGTP